MGAAAYNRGSRLISRETEADPRIAAAIARNERQAHKDENARLRAQVARLESELSRARRCIAELRRSKEARMSEAHAELSASKAAISILCKRAFPTPARTSEAK